MTNSPSRPVRFGASIRERRGDLKIDRSVGHGCPRTFDFDVPSGKARVRPPRPFAGTATYRRPPGGRPRWRGDLSVDFPGRSDIRLTGPGTRASLIRAVLQSRPPVLSSPFVSPAIRYAAEAVRGRELPVNRGAVPQCGGCRR